MKKLTMFLLSLCLTASLTAAAHAAGPMEYAIGGTGDPEYGKPTSIEVVHTPDELPKNEDVSKNAALAPPGFGTASADTLHTGTPLTPNLAPGFMPATGAAMNGSASPVQVPAAGGGAVNPAPSAGTGTVYVPGSSNVTVSGTSSNTGTSTTGYTAVTKDSYYSNGSLGTLKIPSIGVNVRLYQGTDTSALAKGAGHFTNTSIWEGTVGVAGHNRGSHGIFGKIHTLEPGVAISLTTKLGTRTYQVTSVSKVDETDRGALAASAENRLVLYTCVQNQPAYRWCVQALSAES